MKYLVRVFAVLAFAVLTATAQADEFAPLFDGNSLAGWEGNLDTFRIEDGAIVGGTLKAPIPRNEFLCTKEQYRRLRTPVEVQGARQGSQRRRADSHRADSQSSRGSRLSGRPGRRLLGFAVRRIAPQQDSGRRRSEGDRRSAEAGRLERLHDSLRRPAHSAVDQRPANVDYTEPDDKIERSGVDRRANPRRTAQRSLVQRPPHQETLIHS